MIYEIKSLSEPGAALFNNCSDVQLYRMYEPKEGLFIAESPKVIERALDAGYEPFSLLVEKKQISTEASGIISRLKDTPVYTAETDILKSITGFELVRGALCAMKRKKLLTAAQICSTAERIVVLDNVVNPTNVGAIIRNAAALGMDAVLLTTGCSDPFYRRALRVSMGTALQIPWTYVNKYSYIDDLHELGFKTVAMALKDNSLNIDDPSLKKEKRLAVIMGTEGDGLADLNIEKSDYTVCIPMYHGVDSLNVSCASSIACWELGKSHSLTEK